MRETWFSAACHKADTGAGAGSDFGAGRFMDGFPGGQGAFPGQTPFGGFPPTSGLMPWDFQIPSPVHAATPPPAALPAPPPAAPAVGGGGGGGGGDAFAEAYRRQFTGEASDPLGIAHLMRGR